MTDTCGTVVRQVAFMKFMILPGAPRRSASVPITKPGVSISSTSGMLKLSHSTRKSMILRQASADERAAADVRVVGDDADGLAAQAREPDNRRLCRSAA